MWWKGLDTVQTGYTFKAQISVQKVSYYSLIQHFVKNLDIFSIVA